MQNAHPTNRFIAWASAPVTTTKEEEEERAMDKELVEADLYGIEAQKETMEEEVDDNVLAQQLLREVSTMPREDRFAFNTAQSHRPSPVTKDHLNMFVRWAQTCQDVAKEDCLKDAAQRLTSYWEERLQLFGSDRAFCCLFDNEDENTENAMAPDQEALETCGHRVLLEKDEHGRTLLFIDSSRADGSQTFNRDSMNRAFWYVAHSAVANHEHNKDGARRNDIVILYSNENANISDRKMIRRYCLSLSTTLPLDVKAFHFCLCNTHYTNQTLPALKFVLGPHIRKRMVLHFDSTKSDSCRSCSRFQTLAKSLNEYGIHPSMLPHELGGQTSLLLEAPSDLFPSAARDSKATILGRDRKMVLPPEETKVAEEPKVVIPEAVHTTARKTARRISQSARRNSAVVQEAAKMMQSSSRLENVLSNVIQKHVQKGKRFFTEWLPSCTRVEAEGVVVVAPEEKAANKKTTKDDEEENHKNQLLHKFIQQTRLKEEQACTEEKVRQLRVPKKTLSRRASVAARTA